MKMPIPKYEIGQVVWWAHTYWAKKHNVCEPCNGRGKIQATHKLGITDIKCPACEGTGNDGLYCYQPKADKLTIGSIMIDTNKVSKGEGVAYMAYETGIGSGSIYYEPFLFVVPSLALEAASVLALKAQQDFEEEHEKNSYGSWIRRK